VHERFEATIESSRAWVAFQTLIGVAIGDLHARAEKDGLTVRVLSEDGHPYLRRTSHQANRINVEVVGGAISRVDGVG
jgi:hypothetical protein